MTITIENEYVKATFSTKGAELISLQKKSNGQEYIWEGNPNFWAKHAPILFPIVGTLKNNRYIHEDQIFEMNRHGFARDMDFEPVMVEDDKVVFLLKKSENTMTIYPFYFELNIAYSVFESTLQIEYIVSNHDQKKMPFSIGGHPAFALPNAFEKYSLCFEKQEVLQSVALQNELLSAQTHYHYLENKKLALSYSLFEKDALIFKTIDSKEITIYEYESPILKFSFPDFPNLGIWTKVGAPFICLEPWLGYSDPMEANGILLEKEGIQILEPLSFKSYQYSISIL